MSGRGLSLSSWNRGPPQGEQCEVDQSCLSEAQPSFPPCLPAPMSLELLVACGTEVSSRSCKRRFLSMAPSRRSSLSLPFPPPDDSCRLGSNPALSPSQAISISKAINSQEAPVKEKHARRILVPLGSWGGVRRLA